MKLLITGFSGFVSAHFLNLLNTEAPGAEVLGIDKVIPGFDFAHYPRLKIRFRDIDLLNKEDVEQTIVGFAPTHILHLASVSSVAMSWQTPFDSFVNNTNIFLNLVEQVRVNQLPCRILSIGSSEEYGEVAEKDLPLTEESRLHPLSPYAVARVSQEMLSKIYADGFGLEIIITRSFNHIGPGQKENFVISSFAKQMVLLSGSRTQENRITTGDLSITRDFLDVRDVVSAYYGLLKSGRKGEVYNICSGRGILLKDIVLKMASILGMTIKIETDPKLIRPNENKMIVGSYRKIHKELGWQPQIPLEKSLEDIIGYWQGNLMGNHT